MQQEKLKIHAFRIKPGKDLRKEIEEFVQSKKIEAGWIMSVVGSLTQANLRFANEPTGIQLDGHFEIVSLTGTVSIHGCHLHMAISDELGKTTGGHLLLENHVYTTAEIIIGESKKLLFTRKKDVNTGWKELVVNKKLKDK
jgi:predicted DNA-binding protein with PD1-like motif